MQGVISTKLREGAGRPEGAPPWCDAGVLELDRTPASAGGGPPVPPSRPMTAFLRGLSEEPGPEGGTAAPGPLSLRGAVTGEHAVAVLASPHGWDLLAATVGAGAENNAVYCRLAPGGAGEGDRSRGALGAAVLGRLGFDAVVTSSEATGWLAGLPGAEAEERVRLVGRLFAHLARWPEGAPVRGAAEEDVLRRWHLEGGET